jgi:hypothetical protein
MQARVDATLETRYFLSWVWKIAVRGPPVHALLALQWLI